MEEIDKLIAELKAENDRLKEESEKSRIEAYKQGQYGNRQFDKYYKCYQTLQEIKAIAIHEIKELTDSAINGGRYLEILNLITKAGEE